MTKEELKEITDDELVLLAIDVEISLTPGGSPRPGMDSVMRELINRFQYQRGALSAWKLSTAEVEKVKLKDDKCYPCDGRGYTIERVYEADGSENRAKFTCACCNGAGTKSYK